MYGSENSEARVLRLGRGGRLRVTKFRGDDLHDNFNNVIRMVLRDVQLDVQVREEEAGAARVSQSQPPEKEGERQPVRQKQTRYISSRLHDSLVRLHFLP